MLQFGSAASRKSKGFKMSGRVPGPLGTGPLHNSMDQGTSALTTSPTPVPLGAHHGAILGVAPSGRDTVHDSGTHNSSPGFTRPTLSQGSRGSAIVDLQLRLNAKGASPELVVDGIFGPKTRAAVWEYQKRTGLFLDGIAGPITWHHLLLDLGVWGTSAEAAAPPTAPRAAAPPAKRSKDSSKRKARRFIEIHWIEADSYCGGPATLSGTTENYDDGETEQAKVLHVSDGGFVENVLLTISSDAFTESVDVKNWLPRRIGGHFEQSRDEKGVAAGQTTPIPLKMKFIPNLSLTQCTIGISHFDMLVKDYDCQIQGNITYVPGFMAWIIQLGNTVDPAPSWARARLPSRMLNLLWGQPGGQIGVNFGTPKAGSYSGSDWRFAKDDPTSPKGKVYWDGKAWKNVPITWQDVNNVKLYGIGIWREGSSNKAQYGNIWPENTPLGVRPSKQQPRARFQPGYPKLRPRGPTNLIFAARTALVP